MIRPLDDPELGLDARNGGLSLSMAIANARMYAYEERVARERRVAWDQIARGLRDLRALREVGERGSGDG